MNSSERARIDHLLTYVPDLDSASDLFLRMGFLLSPVSRIDAMGISNRMVLMRPSNDGQANYIELMHPHDRALLPAPMVPVLSGEPGIGSLVLVAEELETLHRLILAEGFDIAPPAHVTREWAIPGEPSVFPAFDILLPADAGLRFNACRYYNLHLYTRADWTAHPNGAIRIVKAFAIADNPSDFDMFERLFEQPGQHLPGGARRFPSGDIALEILRPSTLAARFGITTARTTPAYLGYQIEVDSLDRMRGALEAGGVPYHRHNDLLCIAPEIGVGNLIAFSQADQA